MRLMAVVAHPDDAEIWCGGTLFHHAQKGDIVRICNLSYTKDSIRGKEGQTSAKLLGCEVEFLGLEDTAIRDINESVEKLSKSLHSFRPDTIITHWYDDMHPDHEATFNLVRRSLVRLILQYPKNYSHKFPRIYCCDTYHSLGLRGAFRPDRLVDITGVWDKKIAAIKAHTSQDLQLYLDMVEGQSLIHGKSVGVERAEGFIYIPMFNNAKNVEALSIGSGLTEI